MSDFANVATKLENFKIRYNELSQLISDPKIISDNNKLRDLSKEIASIEPIIQEYNNYLKVNSQLSETQLIIKTENDPEMLQLAKEEENDLKKKIEEIQLTLKKLLTPPVLNADKNTIVEIRAGTGGDEAALFTADLYKMYLKYSEQKKWKIEILSSNETELGGYKEIIFNISGKNVYDNMRFEYGGHRVQRIPSTESGGRIHTSAVTVAVLPEVEEADVEIRQEELRIDVMRAGGAGGQHVNKTESAVRITHIPSGIVVQCQDSRSQHKNKASAMKVLLSRLYEKQQEELEKERSNLRKGQVGSGDRSQKVRTYNYPQNRVTDHRINLTLYKLDLFMEGDMDEILEALKINDAELRMKSIE